MRKNAFGYLVGSWLTALLCLSSALGQTVTGAITGQVKERAQSDGCGVCTIRFLPIGTYSVTVEAGGFTSDQVAPFTLEINRTVKIDVALQIGTSSTIVVEEDAHPILDTTDSTLGNTISSNEIENIPLNGRNFSSLTLFQPGAIDTDPTGMTGNNPIERNTFNNGQVSVNGNRAQENNYSIEGAENNEQQNKLIGYNPAHDAIAEVRVVSANANATYGNANGGAIVTILKSGTNHYHG